jgi:bifunctional DNA-binding transcriptional regulator/antitoxin component of YhaV-PrlF toxin-antitoxin module/putative transposon-encoded protein
VLFRYIILVEAPKPVFCYDERVKTTYETVVIGFGNHASIEIPDKSLAEIGGNKRAPLKITINGYTYQSTATGVDGKCMVVFPSRDREASGAKAGDRIMVTLEIDDGYRHVDVPQALEEALAANGLSETFHDLTYSRRKEFARQVSEAKAEDTRARRIEKVVAALKG